MDESSAGKLRHLKPLMQQVPGALYLGREVAGA